MNLEELKFDENGLIPAVVQDARTHRVLTLAYMNRESLAVTLREGRTCFYSRSRRTLWRKGSLVMLDEPAAGLDEKTRVELEKQIAQLPCDILIVAMHNYSPEFLDSFTKVLRIRDGELEP